MKTMKFSLAIALMFGLIFSSCSDDDNPTPENPYPENPTHSGDVEFIELGYSDFLSAAESLKSLNEDFESVGHNHVTTGYNVTILDAYDKTTGDFIDTTYTNVDLTNPSIAFDAIEWFGIVVSHPDYVDTASGTLAYYVVNDDRVDLTGDATITIPLELDQVSVHLANGTNAEFDSQIEAADINGVPVTAFNTPVYVPADVNYTVTVGFVRHEGDDSVTNIGTAGQAFYHVVTDQSVHSGIEFSLPTFETPTDGGGIE